MTDKPIEDKIANEEVDLAVAAIHGAADDAEARRIERRHVRDTAEEDPGVTDDGH
jgi:hypothetical protein